jgi:hypothetical protein
VRRRCEQGRLSGEAGASELFLLFRWMRKGVGTATITSSLSSGYWTDLFDELSTKLDTSAKGSS